MNEGTGGVEASKTLSCLSPCIGHVVFYIRDGAFLVVAKATS